MRPTDQTERGPAHPDHRPRRPGREAREHPGGEEREPDDMQQADVANGEPDATTSNDD